jgi:hypothetical protein
MILRVPILSIAVIAALPGFAQEKAKPLQGKVSYVTSVNVYVRFDNTEAIAVGDTLNSLKNNKPTPCLVVKNKSTISCVAVAINGCTFEVGDLVTYEPGPTPITAIVPIEPGKQAQPDKSDSHSSSRKVRGGISAASYSTLSKTHGNDTKTMYRLSLTAPRINGSRFSIETYMNYRQTFLRSDSGRVHPSDVFNIYNLAVQYDATPTMSFVLGRKINPKVSSIGAIDGLQAEKYFGNFYVGLLAGFRPDIIDYKFNADLLQYGGYVGLRSSGNAVYSTTTLGFIEQTNSGEVDRRYAYFQHSSTINQKVNVFSSFELDLYNQVNADSSGNPRLTNLYIIVSYRISRKVDLSLSYNSRKKILYYETLKTEIERLLDDDIARQGIRATLNFRPSKTLSIGASYNKRFQSNDLNKSDNINGYFSLSKIPAIGGRFYVNYNKNNTSYAVTDILSFRHARQLIKTKLDGNIYFRMVNYYYVDSEERIKQQYYGISLSYQIAKRLVFDVLGEYAATTEQDNYRINARITKTF